MNISNKTKYAIKALILLTKEFGHGPVQISDLSKKEQIPKKFLEAILLTLKNQGLLQSKKGKGGGYLLNKPPMQITIGNIIRIFEGSLAPVPCVSKTTHGKCDECIDEASCGIRLIMKDVHDAITNILDQTSLADVVEREERVRKNRTNVPMYEI